MSALNGLGSKYGEAYRKHTELLEQRDKSQALLNSLHKQVEQSQMKLNESRRLLLQEAELT